MVWYSIVRVRLGETLRRMDIFQLEKSAAWGRRQMSGILRGFEALRLEVRQPWD
jgi:hypothetical protein